MSFTYKRLTDVITLATSAATTIPYTHTSAALTTYVRLINIHNSATSGQAVTLYQVPDTAGSAGTAGPTNAIYKETLAADDTAIIEYPIPGLMLTDLNDTIQGETDTASKVTITITGGQE